MSVDITIQETVNEVDITVNQNVITVNVTRTTGGGGVESINGETGVVVLTTDNVNEGLINLYFTAARVRATVLTGISFVSGIAITATDTILSAFGKLQKQISSLGAVAFSNDYNDLDNKPTIPSPQNLTQVLTQGDISTWLEQIPTDTFVTLAVGRRLTENYYDTSVVGTGGLFLDKTVLFPADSTITFQAGFVEGNPTPSPVTLLPYLFTTDAFVFYNGALIIELTIQPTSVCVLKYGGLESSTGVQIWFLTVLNNTGTGTVTSVTGDLVDNTDPLNPVVETPNLAQVLAIDNKTNDIPIVSNNGKGIVDINDDYTSVGYDTQTFAMTDTEVQLYSEVPVAFDSTVSTDFNTPVLSHNGEEIATQPWVTSQGYGTGTVTSVIGDLVDNTDPLNPVVNVPTLQEITDNEGGASETTGSIQVLALIATNGVQGSEVGAIDGNDSVILRPQGLSVDFQRGANQGQLNANGIDDNYSWELPNQSGTIAMQSDLDFTRRLITKGTGSVTGTVSETILTTLTIPANTLDSSCFIWTTMDFFKTNSGAVTARLYVNNANTLTGATLLGYSTTGSNRNVSFNRKFLVTGTSLDLLTANTASTQVTNEFIENLYGASTVLTINPSADIFLIYTTQNDATGTVATNKMATVQKMKL